MESYASNEPRIGIVKTAMGACAQFAVFTYAEMRRTPRYEIRLAAFFADNLMNSVAHCGGFYLRDIVEEKCRLRPASRKLPGLNREKNTDYAPLVRNFRGSAEKKHELRPACWKLPGLSREKTRITPRLSETSGAQQRKNVDYAPLVRNFRGSAEKKCRLQGIS